MTAGANKVTVEDMTRKERASHAACSADSVTSSRAACRPAPDAQSHGRVAQRIMALLHNRARQQPLPPGYMYCPFNPEHRIPIAVIISHMENVHREDALARLPDAMYSGETATRRRRHVDDELYANMQTATRRRRLSRDDERDRRGRRCTHDEFSSSSLSASYDSGSDSGSSSSHSSCSVVLPAGPVPVSASDTKRANGSASVSDMDNNAGTESYPTLNGVHTDRGAMVDEMTTPSASPRPAVLSASNHIEDYWRGRCLTLRRRRCDSEVEAFSLATPAVHDVTQMGADAVTPTASTGHDSAMCEAALCRDSAAGDETAMRHMIWAAVRRMGCELDDMIVNGSHVLLVFTRADEKRAVQEQMTREPACVPHMTLVRDADDRRGGDSSPHMDTTVA